MSFDVNLIALAAALLIEAVFGYPATLNRMIGHPVAWIGALIGWLDRTLNRSTMPEAVRRINGAIAILIVVVAAAAPLAAVQLYVVSAFPDIAAGLILAVVPAVLLAQRSLAHHVGAVARALDTGDLASARAAVGRIVGRETKDLDEGAVGRAAIESLAENFSDGVVAPAFWCALLGLPGIAAYKVINTADSMLGHRTKRHRAFGWASARLDDLVNLPAARLSALWIALAANFLPRMGTRGAFSTALSDAGKHRSPNAGWPEGAMAGALGLRLGGPRTYENVVVDDGWIGDGKERVNRSDIRRALRLYWVACVIQFAALLVIAAAVVLIARWQ